MERMALAENAMEPCASADSGLFCVYAFPESRRFIGITNAHCSTIVEWFVYQFEEVNTNAVSRTESRKNYSGPRRCIVYGRNHILGPLDFLELVIIYSVLYLHMLVNRDAIM